MARKGMGDSNEQPISINSSSSATDSGSLDLGDENFQPNQSYSRRNQQERPDLTTMNDDSQSQLEENRGAIPVPSSHKNDVITTDHYNDIGGNQAESIQKSIEIDLPNHPVDPGNSIREKDQEISQPRSKLAQQRQRWNNLKVNYDDLRIRFDAAEDRIKSLKIDLQNFKKAQSELQHVHRKVRSQKQNLAIQCEKSNQENHKLKAKVEVLRKDLEACKEDLFLLQPADQVPDTEILEDFDSLCHHIQNWIEVEQSAYETAHPRTQKEPFLTSGQSTNTTTTIRKYSQAGEYFLRYEVHRYLQEYMLGEDVYLLGLGEQDLETFRKLENSMAGLNPARDASTIKTWRSETLRAFAETPGFAKTRKQVIARLSMQLFDSLSQNFTYIQRQKGAKQRFLEQVIQPAAKLATKVNLSPSTYAFAPKPVPNPAGKFRKTIPFDKTFVTASTLIDVNTRRTLKPESKLVVEREGILGNVLMFVEPGLTRKNANGATVELRKTVYLVDLFGPLGKRKREARGRPCEKQDGAARIKREEDPDNA